MNDENLDQNDSSESNKEVEQQTLIVKSSCFTKQKLERYSQPDIHSSFALSTIEYDPKLVKEEVDLTEGKLWKRAMEKEIESLKKNKTWDLVALPDERKPFGSNWVFKKNMNVLGRVKKYKY